MASYFESINDALTVQITDDFTNYALWKKGRVASTAGPAGITRVFRVEFNLPSSGAIPIIVFDTTPGTGVMVLSQSFKNGMAYAMAYSTYHQDPDSLTYYVYLPANDPQVAVQGRGLFTLWDEQGRVVFDSEANYLKVLDQINHHYQAAPYSKTYPVGKVGVVSSKAQWYVDPAGTPGGWNAFAGCAVITAPGGSLNTVTAGYHLLRTIVSGPNAGRFPDPNDSGNRRRGNTMTALVCDITNLDKLPYDIIT